jgi:hypothetical protein
MSTPRSDKPLAPLCRDGYPVDACPICKARADREDAETPLTDAPALAAPVGLATRGKRRRLRRVLRGLFGEHPRL